MSITKCGFLALVLSALSAPALAQNSVSACNIFLNKPVFTSSTTTKDEVSRESFKKLECSASWKSAQEAQSAGISATVPIYGIPVPFTANWNDNQVQQWKNENCTSQEKESSSKINYYNSVYNIDPISAKAALACFEALSKANAEAAEGDALKCTLTETSSSYVFEARWRRTAGENDNKPVISSFSTLYTTCPPSDAFVNGSKISEGGVSGIPSFANDPFCERDRRFIGHASILGWS